MGPIAIRLRIGDEVDVLLIDKPNQAVYGAGLDLGLAGRSHCNHLAAMICTRLQ
jgi:hypothetical protein